MSIDCTRQGIGLSQLKIGLILAVALQSLTAFAQSAPPQEVKQKKVPAASSTTQQQRTAPTNPFMAPASKSIAPTPAKKIDPEKPAQAPTAPAPASPLPPLPPVDTTKPPPMLPRASREQMHACAEQWHELKMSSTQDLPMWRHFAARCLAQEEKTKADK